MAWHAAHPALHGDAHSFIHPSVRPSVRPSVHPSIHSSIQAPSSSLCEVLMRWLSAMTYVDVASHELNDIQRLGWAGLPHCNFTKWHLLH